MTGSHRATTAGTNAPLVVLAFAITAASCIQSSSVTCADGAICPTDRVCDEVNHTCVFPDQLTSCLGAADGAACDINEAPGGICRGMICIPAACGDGLVAGAEVCDGTGDIPDVGTCVDFGYDAGRLSCSALCTEELDSCQRLGWTFRAIGSQGLVSGIWEDGADLWVAHQTGILRRHEGVWQPGEPVANRWYRGIWAGSGHAFAVAVNGSVSHYNGTAWDNAQVTQVAGSQLLGVWGRSLTDVFAVGGTSTAGEIWRFNGMTWSPMMLPASTPQLHAVWGAGSDVFAVGNAGTILRLAGTWAAMSSPTGHDLRSVWGSSGTDVFAVGSQQPQLPQADAVIIHFSGSTWSVMPNVPPETLELRGISGRSATEVYAVGARTGSNILYYDGNAWTPMVTSAASPAASLPTVFAGASAVYAARQGTFLEYDAGWLETSASSNVNVRGLWGTGDYVVGVGDGLSFQEYQADQGTWSEVSYPGCWGTTNFVFGVWGSSRNNVWIVGPYGKLLHKTTVGAVTVVDCVTAPSQPKWLVDVWGSGASDVFAVGAEGSGTDPNLIHFDGSSWSDWSDRVRPYVMTLSGVWGSGPTNVYVTGDTKILHYDGSTWSDTGLVTDHDLSAIWGSSATDVFAVGSEGAIFHYDGTSWTQMSVPLGITTPTDGTWRKVYGTGPNDVYVVGSRTLLHYDGTSWAPISRLVVSSVEAVWAVPGTVFTAGEAGLDARLIGTLR